MGRCYRGIQKQEISQQKRQMEESSPLGLSELFHGKTATAGDSDVKIHIDVRSKLVLVIYFKSWFLGSEVQRRYSGAAVVVRIGKRSDVPTLRGPSLLSVQAPPHVLYINNIRNPHYFLFERNSPTVKKYV